MDASGALKRSYTGPCDQIRYYDRGSENYEFCFRLCNKGGGLMDVCGRLCQDYLKCIGAKTVGAALDDVTTTSLSTGGIIAIVCACVLLVVIAGVGFLLYRRYTSRPNHEPPRVHYARGPDGDDDIRIQMDPLMPDDVIKGTQPEGQDSSRGPRDETVILN